MGERPRMRRKSAAEVKAEALEEIRWLQESGQLVIRKATEAELEAVFGRREENGHDDRAD